jgi:hypothetical protein
VALIPIPYAIMNPASAFTDVRVVTMLLLTMFAAGACSSSDYDAVQPPPPPTPEVATLAVTLGAPVIEVGQETIATVAAVDQYGNSITPGTVAWTSSSPNVAVVDATGGAIRGVALGTARITATVDGQGTAAQIITVVNAPANGVGAGALKRDVAHATNPDTLVGDALARLRAVTVRFHDVAVADSVGYSVALTGCVSDATLGGMGFHVGKASAIDGTVDPLEPEVLLYEPQANGQRRLVAVEFIVPYQLQPRSGPAPRLFGRDFIPNDGFGLWTLHAWIWRNNPSGMFAEFNPTVSCGAEPAATHAPHSSGQRSPE